MLPDGDARLVERVAHQLLHAKRLRGEWFDVDIAEAVAAVGQAIDLVEAGDLSILETAKARDTRTITSLRIDPEILVRLKVAAARERLRVNEVVVEAILDRLELLERRHRQGEAA